MTKFEKKKPHGFRTSEYKRRSNEGYYTEHWVTKCLLPYIPKGVANICDPAAGRGDILTVLQGAGYRTMARDIDVAPWKESKIASGLIKRENFFESKMFGTKEGGVQGLVFNPPYGGDQILFEGRKRTVADAFLRHALNQDVRFVAALLRTDFNHSSKRVDLFRAGRDFPYSFEVVLTKRPVWDWWIVKDDWETKSPSPMHNFSWFCWVRGWAGPSTQYWMGPKDVDAAAEVCDEAEDGE